MLPSFPEAQKILDTEYHKRILAAKTEIFPHVVHPAVRILVEGKRSDYQREDGEIRPFKAKKQVVSATINIKDGKGLTLEMFLQKARELGEGLGKQMWKAWHIVVDESVEETGNKVEFKKGCLKQEDVLRMMEMTPLSLDERGEAQNVLIMHPSMFEEFKTREAEWANDAEFAAKVEELYRRKAEEYNEREARRRLVE